MAIKRKLFIFIFFILCITSLTAQSSDDEIMRINNYVVKTYSHTKELSNSIKPYEDALGVKGLSFKQIAPDDPQTDDTQNWIEIGDWKSKDSFFLRVNAGEWVSGFSIYNSSFQVSIGNLTFKIGDDRSTTLHKLFYSKRVIHSKNLVQLFYDEGLFYIGFKKNKISHFRFENTSY